MIGRKSAYTPSAEHVALQEPSRHQRRQLLVNDAACMSHDRIGAKTMPLTQEFLGQMLGTRRSSVSMAASILQKGGMISYTRGNVTILNETQLAEAACECYQIIIPRDCCREVPRGRGESFLRGPFAIAPRLMSTIAQNNNKHPVYSDDRCGAATREGGKWRVTRRDTSCCVCFLS